jgi:hypothetical protein
MGEDPIMAQKPQNFVTLDNARRSGRRRAPPCCLQRLRWVKLSL